MKVPNVDKAMFNGPFGEIVDALDPHTEGSRVGVLGTLVAAFSGYLGQHTKVQTGNGLSPLMFWTVLVGQTGKGRKGTATRIGMKVVEQAFSAWSEENVIHGCPATGLGFIQELAERADADSTTPVMVIEEEMDDFIGNAKKDKRIGVYLRKAWDGATLVHKTKVDDITVREPHVGFVGHVQPRNWAAIAGSRDATGGTYNRFLPLAVERSKNLPVFSQTDTTELVREQARKLRRMAQNAREIDVVRVRPDVAEWFEEFHRPVVEQMVEGSEELAQMSERAMAYLIRLAALYALAGGRDEIEVEDLDAALALVQYSVDTVLAVLPEAGGERLGARILAALEANGELSRSELWDIIGRNFSARDITNALKGLPQVVTRTGKSTGGRPPVFLRLVTDDEFAPAANGGTAA